MIRNIFVTLLFFFGPALLMFMLRNIFLFWKMRRHTAQQSPEIVNITPINQMPPSRFFLASAVTVGLVFASLVWLQLTDNNLNNTNQQYTPAHINEHGELIQGQRLPLAKP